MNQGISRVPYYLHLLLWELKLQYRYYFWGIAVVVTLGWLGLLFSLSSEVIAQWMPVLIFADICNIALLFIAGIWILERRQGTIAAAAVSPLPAAVWLALKIVGLCVLCMACALALILFTSVPINWLRVIIAVILSTALFACLGFILACPFENIMNYFLVMAMATALLNLPVLDYLGILQHPLMWLIPSQGAMHLLQGSMHDMSGVSFYGNAIVLSVWTAVVFLAGVRLMKASVAQG